MRVCLCAQLHPTLCHTTDFSVHATPRISLSMQHHGLLCPCNTTDFSGHATPRTSLSMQHHGLLCPPGIPVHGIFQPTRVGCHFLLLGTCVTQRSNPSLVSPALADRLFTTAPPGKPNIFYIILNLYYK